MRTDQSMPSCYGLSERLSNPADVPGWQRGRSGYQAPSDTAMSRSECPLLGTPAQIPACATRAPGSCLGCLRCRKADSHDARLGSMLEWCPGGLWGRQRPNWWSTHWFSRSRSLTNLVSPHCCRKPELAGLAWNLWRVDSNKAPDQDTPLCSAEHKPLSCRTPMTWRMATSPN